MGGCATEIHRLFVGDALVHEDVIENNWKHSAKDIEVVFNRMPIIVPDRRLVFTT